VKAALPPVGAQVYGSRPITDSLGPRLAQTRDVAAVAGLLATLEGELLVAPEGDALPDWAAPLAHRLGCDGLSGEDAGQREVRQAMNDLNHGLRYVLGEYSDKRAQYREQHEQPSRSMTEPLKV
jgi:hypothetical protein